MAKPAVALPASVRYVFLMSEMTNRHSTHAKGFMLCCQSRLNMKFVAALSIHQGRECWYQNVTGSRQTSGTQFVSSAEKGYKVTLTSCTEDCRLEFKFDKSSFGLSYRNQASSLDFPFTMRMLSVEHYDRFVPLNPAFLWPSFSLLTSPPASVSASRRTAARSRFLSSSFSSLLAELKTPFVPVPQAAQAESFRYRFSAHGSQK